MPHMATATPTRQLADYLLDGKLDAYVLGRRSRGLSWRRISLELRDDIGLDVTHETLRSWYPDQEEAS